MTIDSIILPSYHRHRSCHLRSSLMPSSSSSSSSSTSSSSSSSSSSWSYSFSRIIIPSPLPLSPSLLLSLLLLLTGWSSSPQCYHYVQSLSSPPRPPSKSKSTTTQSFPPNIKAIVIVPGFLTGASDLQPLADTLTKRYGIPSVCVPMPSWHWIPCLGGRSMRPILERIDFTVRALCASGGQIDRVPTGTDYYSIMDCLADFKDNPGGVMAVGGSEDVDEYPVDVQPRGKFPVVVDYNDNNDDGMSRGGRIALVGHSAGGWISRIYLSSKSYGGKSYGGSRFVHSLVTLGTPNADADGAAFRGLEWVNRVEKENQQQKERDEEGNNDRFDVAGLAVAGAGFCGADALGDSYDFCGGEEGVKKEDVDGDGLTPVFSALNWKKADQMLLRGKVTHFPWENVLGGGLLLPELVRARERNVPWYGDTEVMDQWVPWFEQFF